MAIYSVFSRKKMVIFHGYVSLPEGNPALLPPMTQCLGDQVSWVQLSFQALAEAHHLGSWP